MNIETSTILPNLAMRLTVVLGLITQCIFGQTPKLEISKIDSIPKTLIVYLASLILNKTTLVFL